LAGADPRSGAQRDVCNRVWHHVPSLFGTLRAAVVCHSPLGRIIVQLRLQIPGASTFTASGLQSTLKTFVEGPTLFLHHAVPLLEGAVAARGGTASVINISSVVGQRYSASLPVYSMAKAAVDVLTKSAAGSLGPKGIRVNSVSPGPVFTDILVSAGLTQEASNEFFNGLGNKSALGRAGQPQEVSSLVRDTGEHAEYRVGPFRRCGCSGGISLRLWWLAVDPHRRSCR
jgi:NAD(P)-dependent dehydrogenase (short-subunit alcohol dehydrogenase family)